MPVPARRFALRVLVFFAPLLIFIGLLEAALWKTGETIPVAQIVKWQNQNREMGRPTLWLRADLDENVGLYKMLTYEARRPKIIALGSSRVLKFRGEMLGREGKDFFNCGRTIRRIEDLETFVNSLTPETTPRVIFLGVDHWWLNPNHPKDSFPDEDATLDWRAHLTLWRDLSQQRKLRGDLRRALRLRRAGVLGIHARVTGGGFRDDGSLASDDNQPRTWADWKINDKWKRKLLSGAPMSEFASGISPQRLQRLRACLQKLQAKNVLVLVFAPPQISGAVKLLSAMPQHRELWREYLQALPALCRELNIPYCDASIPQKFGLNDTAMYDGIHAEETLHLYILREWLKDARVREALPDASRVVETAIKSKRTGLWFPDYGAANDASSTPAKIQPGGQPSVRPPRT